MKRFFNLFVLSIWMIPQNMLGLLCFIGFWISDFISGKDFRVLCPSETGRVILISSHQSAGVTLGFFSVLSYREYARYSRAFIKTQYHEYGHFIQSAMLGPLYLILIGMPSITWNVIQYLYCRVTGKGLDYYGFYTERWADKIGNVNR